MSSSIVTLSRSDRSESDQDFATIAELYFSRFTREDLDRLVPINDGEMLEGRFKAANTGT